MKDREEKIWGLEKVWNKSLAGQGRGGRDPKDHIWATDLGKPTIDTWLKMKGVDPTNPPNARSRRKFEAGNIWEWLVSLILKRAGILKEEQEYVKHQYEDLLQVTGYLDFLAGGEPDYLAMRDTLDELDLPEKFEKAGENIVRHLKKEYPDGLDTRVVELKSTSSYMFDKIEKNGEASENHQLQLFHYLKGKDMKRGMVVYICRDDCRMIEIPVWNTKKYEKKYKKAIKEITYYYKKDERPPLEKPIVFDEEFEKFSKNWGVEYSDYLTKLYDFKKPKEFYEKYGPKAKSWNRVLTRMKKGKDMTENNKEKIEQMRDMGFDVERIKNIITDDPVKDKEGKIVFE